MYSVIFKLSNRFRIKNLEKVRLYASRISGFTSFVETVPPASDDPDSFGFYSAAFSDEQSRDIFRLVLRHNFNLPSIF